MNIPDPVDKILADTEAHLVNHDLYAYKLDEGKLQPVNWLARVVYWIISRLFHCHTDESVGFQVVSSVWERFKRENRNYVEDPEIKRAFSQVIDHQ